MADREDIESRARALLDNKDASPDMLISSMREVLGTKRPWWDSIGHTVTTAIGGSLFTDKFDAYEQEIEQYSRFWNSVKSGQRKLKEGPGGLPKIVEQGKKILRNLLNDEPITAASLFIDSAEFARDTVYDAAAGAKEAAKSVAQDVKQAVTPSISTTGILIAVGLLAVAVATRGRGRI